MHANDNSPGQRPDVTVGVDDTEVAHLLVPLSVTTDDMARFGIAECGYPAEHLTLVPGLSWSRVTPDRRCEHCDASERPAPASMAG